MKNVIISVIAVIFAIIVIPLAIVFIMERTIDNSLPSEETGEVLEE